MPKAEVQTKQQNKEQDMNLKSLAYIGTKMVTAAAMTRLTYNEYRGWDLPENEKHLANEEGYLVEYKDGGRSNDARHEGYISWSPADVFDKSYRCNGSMRFSDVLDAVINAGPGNDRVQIARKGWNGAGLSVHMQGPVNGIDSFLVIFNPNTDKVNTWVPSSADLMAEDWMLV